MKFKVEMDGRFFVQEDWKDYITKEMKNAEEQITVEIKDLNHLLKFIKDHENDVFIEEWQGEWTIRICD